MSTQLSEAFSVGDGINAPNASWSFGADVPKTFVDHVRRSVPLYEEGHDLICQLSDYFVSDGSVGYEIGVSTGELLGKLVRHNAGKRVKWVGLDVEENMIAQARTHLEGMKNVALHVADASLWDFEKSDMVVSYYCLQFVPPKRRQDVINKIYESLNWGAASSCSRRCGRATPGSRTSRRRCTRSSSCGRASPRPRSWRNPVA